MINLIAQKKNTKSAHAYHFSDNTFSDESVYSNKKKKQQ